jgi:Uma2 family endonuclease
VGTFGYLSVGDPAKVPIELRHKELILQLAIPTGLRSFDLQIDSKIVSQVVYLAIINTNPIDSSETLRLSYMVRTSVELLTLDEFLKLPETEPASEYIDGRITQKPMPQGKHSSIQTEFATTVNGKLRSNRIARAFSELRCTFGGRSIVPDISVFIWSRISRDENGEIANIFQMAPDWTIEILSPDQSQTKVTKNILHCLDCGSEMGWSIDPEEKTVLVYRPKQQTLVFDLSEQQLPVPTFAADVKLTVAEVFNWLLE